MERDRNNVLNARGGYMPVNGRPDSKIVEEDDAIRTVEAIATRRAWLELPKAAPKWIADLVGCAILLANSVRALRAALNEWRESEPMVQEKLAAQSKTIEAMKKCLEVKNEALSRYARDENFKDKWAQYACDKFTGRQSHFDWVGDDADEPWEFAEKALAATPADFLEPNKSEGA